MAQSAVIAASSSGDNTVIAATTGFAIRVIGYVLSFSAGGVNAQWKSDVGGGAVNLSGLIYGPTGAAGAVNTDVDVDASSATAASANNVTLAGAAGATTYITGFEITGAGATGASEIAITITGVLGGTKTYDLAIPAGATVAVTPLIVEFSRPIPASAVNTAIVVNVPSFGAGNLNAAVTAHGFQRTAGVAGGAVRDTVVPEAQPGGRGWFQTASGKALNLNLSAAVAVGGHVMYELVSQ